MTDRCVTVIPAVKGRLSEQPDSGAARRRVAAYARVSTDHEEQQSSYEAQVDYYTSYIQNRADWEFVSVYADEGITGCSTKGREGFKRMISDALSGRIDLIVTKSVSRFARNTVDSLTTIRKLKENRVEVYFEKENIWTFDGKGELLLTIMSSIAQEESRSISENCIWGQRKRFADGKFSVAFSSFLGYERGEDGRFVINENQARIVRRIYGLFLQGRTPYAIAKILTEEGVPTPAGKRVWSFGTVRSILTNEKYKGDALLQKRYTVDFLSKKKKVNEGEVTQYYVKGCHEAIIEPEIFDRVQEQIRTHRKGRSSGRNLFSGKVRCGDCGNFYGPKVWHSNDKYRKAVWQCGHKFDGECKCTTPHLTEAEITEAVLDAVSALIGKRSAVELEVIRGVVSDSGSSGKQEREEAVNKLLKEWDTGVQITEISDDLLHSLVECITVYSKEDIRVLFRDGTEVSYSPGSEKRLYRPAWSLMQVH